LQELLKIMLINVSGVTTVVDRHRLALSIMSEKTSTSRPVSIEANNNVSLFLCVVNIMFGWIYLCNWGRV